MIDRCGGIISTVNRRGECHDKRNHAINLLGGFLFVRLNVACRVGANEYIVCHPAHDGMPVVRYFFSSVSFISKLHEIREKKYTVEEMTYVRESKCRI